MKENIPDFQTLMLPLMELLRDNKEHPLPEVLDVMASKFALTEEELRIMVSSGQQTLFKNRVTWAISYLKNAGLIEYPKRAVYKITESGKSIFKEDLTAITTGYLKKFEAYRQWQSSLNQHQNITKPAPELHETMTPEEIIGDNFDKINDKLGTELLELIRQKSPSQFERFVLELLDKWGMEALPKKTLKLLANRVTMVLMELFIKTNSVLTGYMCRQKNGPTIKFIQKMSETL